MKNISLIAKCIIVACIALTSCKSNTNEIKSTTETSTAIATNISMETNIQLANPDDVCPISMPVNCRKEYDKKGLLTKEIYYNENNQVSSATTFEYQNGLEKKQTKYSASGAVENIIESEYTKVDGKKKIKKSTTYTGFGTVSYSDEFYYQDGQTTQITTDTNGDCFCKNRVSFDGNGNKVLEEMEIYGVAINISYKYNSKNQLIEQSDTNGTKWAFSYDEQGNLKEKKCIYLDGSASTESYSYKYDSHNNWIEKTCSYDGKSIYVTKREIEYF